MNGFFKPLEKYPSQLILLVVMIFAVPMQALSETSDIRVLIDVSGSMKKNDPKNLRAPAVRLLVGLMPEGTSAGIWTFAQYVNMQVKHGKVNKNWKSIAANESKKIHSRGLYTNIEEALRRASASWNNTEPTKKRNIILLTDGMVDVAKDKQKNQASRQRVINELLPKLKKAKVKVHAIALSDNVDKELLGLLSGQTGGWYEEVADASELERAFLKLFEASAATPTLAINKNRFSVDSSINDMTVLVFRGQGEHISLTTPAGKQSDYKNKPAQFEWVQENNYELITVKKPEVGDWVIGGSKDPDNRVMIVTNLKLVTNSLPTAMLRKDKILVEASLYDQDKKISKSSFLELVKFSVNENNSLLDYLIDAGENGDKKAKDAVYSGYPLMNLSEGEHEVIIRAVGATFERNIRHRILSFDTLAHVKTPLSKEGDKYYIQLIPHTQLLKPDSLNVSASIEERPVAISKDPGGLWSGEVGKENEGKTVEIKIEGKRNNEKEVSITLSKPIIDTEHKAKKVEKSKAEEKEPEQEKNKENKTQKEDDEPKEKMDKQEGETGEEKDEETNWLMVSWVVLMINIVLAIIGILGFKWWKKKRDKAKAEEAEEVSV